MQSYTWWSSLSTWCSSCCCISIPSVQSCMGVWFLAVRNGWWIHAVTHCWRWTLMRGRYTKCKQNIWMSLSGSSMSMDSRYRNRSWWSLATSLYTSRHRRSMRWLCTLLPTSIEPRPGPRCGWLSINREMPTFSLPLSDLTCEGNPYELLEQSSSKLF